MKPVETVMHQLRQAADELPDQYESDVYGLQLAKRQLSSARETIGLGLSSTEIHRVQQRSSSVDL